MVRRDARPLVRLFKPSHHRLSSSNNSPPLQSLLTRSLPPIYDYLTPTPTHHLHTTLSSFLPLPTPPSPTLPTLSPTALPPGHHLIYFNPITAPHALLPDGTDPAHSPGPPWTRRMWAGGGMAFAPSTSTSPRVGPEPSSRLRLDGRRAVCEERVVGVRTTGPPGSDAEKVWVTVERAMRYAELGAEDVGVRERRELVFLREKETGKASSTPADTTAQPPPRKVVRAPHAPTFTHTLRPSRTLLFRFSALTSNAHAIHLDTLHTRSVEGHRDLLVHGPLMLVLMLEVVGMRLRGNEGLSSGMGVLGRPGEKRGGEREILSVEYRNLSPLVVGEEMRVCGREKEGGEEMEVWVEGPEAGMAVKGTVKIGRV
ncbi:MAG: hypothetical protein M1833_001458 [Piccolia ochrophora]|nr:MAG: hypothetical protein M1833_001458 [Piccolia ochrophora]